MDEKLKELWSKNKLLALLAGLVLVPLILLFLFKDLIFAMLAGSAHKAVDAARTEDEKLKSQADQAALDAAVAKAEADAAAKRIAARKEDDVSEDWNKKS